MGVNPWRGEPANAAGACLWDFGIQDGSMISDFSERLTIIEEGKVYSLRCEDQKYIVYIRTEKGIPIAYKLEIKK
jgi:hypothetical protein